MRGRYPVIAALDPPVGPGVEEWVESRAGLLGGLVAGCKLGLPLAVNLGVDRLRRLVAVLREHSCPMVVADFKIADVPHVSGLLAESARRAGFDVVIAHWFIGVKGLSEVAARFGGELWVVTSLSSGSPAAVFDALLPRALETAQSAGGAGLIAPATRPHLITLARRLGWDRTIAAPGVGRQGARPCAALEAGADYEIVGRSLVGADNPAEWLRKSYSTCRPGGP